jgi:MFS family permease
MALVGVGMGLMMPNFSLWLMGFAPLALRGRVIGGLTMAIFIGQFISPLVVVPLLTVTDIAGSLWRIGLGAVALGFAVGVGALLARGRDG